MKKVVRFLKHGNKNFYYIFEIKFYNNMRTRQKLEDENAEKIIQLLEYGASINLFSSELTPFQIDDFMGDDSNRDNQ